MRNRDDRQHLEYVESKDSPKKIWDVLHNLFERQSNFVTQIITTKRMLPEDNLCIQFDVSDDVIWRPFAIPTRSHEKEKGAGSRMEEADVICHVFKESYDVVTTAIETVSNLLTMDLVRRSCLDVETKRHDQRANETSTALCSRLESTWYLDSSVLENELNTDLFSEVFKN